MEIRYDQYKDTVKPALISKINEFELYGYDKVLENELWEFLNKKKWKREREEKRLHEIVSDILAVKVGEYMNYATVEAFKSPDWFSGDGLKELDKLL
jgi:hypothetical protein